MKWCAQRGVVVEAYCPLVRGQRFEEEALGVLARRYGKTPAQVLVRWSLQKVRGSVFFFFHYDDEVEFSQLICFVFLDRDSCPCPNRSRTRASRRMRTSTVSG